MICPICRRDIEYGQRVTRPQAPSEWTGSCVHDACLVYEEEDSDIRVNDDNH